MLLDSDALELSGVVANSAKKNFTLNYRYLGADDAAAPNYTGQAAVNSHYDQLEI